MKTITFLSLIVALQMTLAAESPTSELTAARARYEAAVGIAVKPIRERYLEELKRMKEKALFDRKAELALAIDTEIKGMGGAKFSAADLRVRLANTTWKWWQDETITFLADGKIKWSHDNTQLWTWKITDPSKRTIEISTSKGPNIFIIGEDMKSGTMTESGRSPRSTELITTK